MCPSLSFGTKGSHITFYLIYLLNRQLYCLKQFVCLKNLKSIYKYQTKDCKKFQSSMTGQQN